jgi:hypothetical protein
MGLWQFPSLRRREKVGCLLHLGQSGCGQFRIGCARKLLVLLFLLACWVSVSYFTVSHYSQNRVHVVEGGLVLAVTETVGGHGKRRRCSAYCSSNEASDKDVAEVVMKEIPRLLELVSSCVPVSWSPP